MMLKHSLLLAAGALAPFGLTGLWVYKCDGHAKSQALAAAAVSSPCCAAEAAAVEPEPMESAAEPQGATGDSTIKGTIKFDGAAPARAPLDMAADGVCVKAHEGSPVLKDDVIVANDGGLKNVFVYIKKGVEGKYDPPKDSATLDQKGCVYTPHVFGIVAGQKIIVKNGDGTTHNVHSLARKNTNLNVGQPAGSKDLEVVWKKNELNVWIKCDMHSWMSSLCHVVAHPFFAVSADNGSFEIKNLPAGDYTIGAVHETLGEQTFDVKIAAKETKEQNFTFKAK